MISFEKGLLLSAISIILTGCGGGASNIRKDNPLDPSKCMPYTSETYYRTWNQTTCNFDIDDDVARNMYVKEEYLNTEFLSYHNAYDAWARGITGEGVTVAVLDSGIKDGTGTSERVVASGDFVNETTTAMSVHGTAVGSVIAGKEIVRDDGIVGMGQGVAFNADLLDVKVCNSVGNCMGSNIVAGGKWAIEQGADILNLSLGGNGWVDYSLHEKARDNDVLMVWAAGNNHSALNPQDSAAGCLTDASFCDTNIAVGGAHVNQDDLTGELDYSSATSQGNKAGNMKDHFLVAAYTTEVENLLGKNIQMSGTSFAAPAVSGAAALVKERHAHLTSGEVKAILLESATDLGEAGVDEVFGHGLLNIKGAMAPLGDFGFSTSSTVNSAPKKSAEIVTSNINMQSFTLSTTAAFDKYGRDYAIPNAELTKQAVKIATINALNVSELHSQKEFENSIQSDLFEIGISPKKKGVKANVTKGIKVGLSQETDSFLGSEFKGLFGNINTTSATVEVEKHFLTTSKSYVKGNAQAKASSAKGRDSFTKSINAIAVDLGVEAGIDMNGLVIKGSVALPNNVVSGKARFVLPQGRTLDGQIISEEISSDIKSEWAPVLSASIETMLSEDISFQAGAQTNGVDVGIGAGFIRHW